MTQTDVRAVKAELKHYLKLQWINNIICLFTPPTLARQNCLVWSCPYRRCEQNWRQDKTVLSCLDPVSNLQLFSLKYIEDYWKLENWKLGRDETKLCCLVSSCVHTADTDKTRKDRLVLSLSAVWTSYYKHRLISKEKRSSTQRKCLKNQERDRPKHHPSCSRTPTFLHTCHYCKCTIIGNWTSPH